MATLVRIQPPPPGTAPFHLAAEIECRAGGAGVTRLEAGFSPPEPTHCWGLFPACTVALPPVAAAPAAFLLLHVNAAFFHPRGAAGLRVILHLQGRRVFDNYLRAATVIAIEVPEPAALPAGATLEISCPEAVHPAAAGHAETRFLTVSLARIWLFTGAAAAAIPPPRRAPPDPGPAALLARFESLGHSCDFGLIQRDAGIEPLGLLRFAAIEVAETVAGILAGFAGAGAPENLVAHVEPSTAEWYATESRYGMRWNTRVPAAQADAAEIVAREAKRLPFLARKFAEDVAAGEKIFLLKRVGLMPWEELALWVALNARAPNRLLCLVQRPGAAPGPALPVRPRLWRAKVPPDMALPDWLRVCGSLPP